MDATSLNREGNAGLQMDEDPGEFLTMEILSDQLAVVEHYLEMTPSDPFTGDRDRLLEEKDQLLRMIERKFLETEEDSNTTESHASSSPTTSISPSLSGQPGPSNSASISGFSTPDLFSSRDHKPFASAIEEELPDTNRMVQELADYELAQQLAQTFGSFSQDDMERQRRAQIEADEELARQIQAAMSPVQQRSTDQPALNTDSTVTMTSDPRDVTQSNAFQSVFHSPLMKSGFDLNSPSMPSSSDSSPFQSNPQGSASLSVCQTCGQLGRPGETACWMCTAPYTHLNASETANPVPTDQQQLHWVPPYGTQIQQQPLMVMGQRHQPLSRQQLSEPQRMRQQQIQRQQELLQIRYLQQLSTSANNNGMGTSSNPINLGDSPPLVRTPQIPSFPSFPFPQPNPPVLNGGWPTSYSNPFAAQAVKDPAAYITQYDYSGSTPSSEEIKDLLANIRPDEDIKVEDKDAIIPGLARQMRLMKHQQMGLAWMHKMEDGKNKGGLLADEMGLGKTIQSIALLVSRPSDDEDRRTTLICTPVALLRQWFNELRTKTDPPLNVYIHHTSSRGRRARTGADLLNYDIVLTTYNTLAVEWKALDKYNNQIILEKPTCLFLDTKWYRVILDESQVIKNRNTQTAKACFLLDSIYRWSLSGTPMQNGVDEMYSQLAFLRIRPYCEWKPFHSTFVMGFKRPWQRKEAMTKFQAVLKAILLRRTKTSKIDGVEILKGLPGKTVEMVHAVFDPEQDEFYRALETGAILQMKKYQAAGTLGRNFGNALVLLLRLRQACLHPKLIKEVKLAGSVELTEDQQVALAKEFNEQTVTRIKQIDTFECPICFETVLNPSLILPCGHHYCTECLASLFDQEREDAIGRGTDDARDKGKCPECRGEMDAKRLVSLETFKKAHCSTVDEDEVDSYDGSASEAEEDDDFLFQDERKRKGKGKEPATKSRKRPRPAPEEDEDWVTSAKVDKLCEILEGVRAKDPSEKVIVFSQFTGFLDIIGPALDARNFKFGRYDGSMTARSREEELETFKTDPIKTICLVSLRAGAYGLNLTCASQCVILDPFWNPFIEAQAIDRIHRIGQSKEVLVHRIVIAGTVEDRILALQDKKRDIIEGALAEDASKAIARLSAKDLLFLFGING